MLLIAALVNCGGCKTTNRPNPYSAYASDVQLHTDSLLELIAIPDSLRLYRMLSYEQLGESALVVVRALHDLASSTRQGAVAPPPELQYAHTELSDVIDTVAARTQLWAGALLGARLARGLGWESTLEAMRRIDSSEAGVRTAVTQYLVMRRRVEQVLHFHGVQLGAPPARATCGRLSPCP